MSIMKNFPLAMRLYFCISAVSLGCVEFIHDWKRYSKVFPENYIKNFLCSTPGFLTGFVLGPASPFFYIAGCKSLDYKKCPHLK